MSDADRERWNARYAAGEYAARTHPSPLLAAWIGRLPRGRALDVACGRGRNAIHLAAHGYAVDAVDISAVALAKARERAEAAGVAIRWIETDLDGGDIARDTYDVIVVARFLDRPLIPQLINALRPGGHIVYEHHYITSVDVGGPSSRRFRARPNELLERFRALRVLFWEEGIVADPDGRHMALARLVACKGSPGYLYDAGAIRPAVMPATTPHDVADQDRGTIMSDPARLHDVDFYRWTQEQAALLRQIPGERINLPIDWHHAAEEIEDMGRSDLRAVNSRIGVILEHLLKLEHSPAEDPRAGWIDTVARGRDDVSRILDDSPSLRREFPERWLKEYALARRGAARSLAQDGIDATKIPTDPPYTPDQVLDPDWWPANRHGPVGNRHGP